MPAIDHLLKRWGFVKLSRYGLVLTPEGRIMSLRPEVLDDGAGGRIVGWQDRDLAPAELARWELSPPAPARAVATPVAATPARTAIASLSTAIATVSAPTVPAQTVAQRDQVDEDEWEWEIALARARVAAEDVQQVRVVAPPVTVSTVRRSRPDTVPPPVQRPVTPKVPTPPPVPVAAKLRPVAKTLPMAAVAAPKITFDPVDTSGEWPKTAAISQIKIDYPQAAREPDTVPDVAPLPDATPDAVIELVRIPDKPVTREIPAVAAASRSTVIPVPELPRRTATMRIEPVVRSSPASAPRRLAKGTRPVTGPSSVVGVVPPPPIRPAEDDRTKPGIALPSAARSVALPSIKQRMASQGR